MELLSADEILSRIRSEYTTTRSHLNKKSAPKMLLKKIEELVDLESEEWKTIKGFEQYEISNKGRVVSKKYGYRKLLKINEQKYCNIVLSKEKKSYTRLIHRLVADNFMDIKDEDTITHLDGNRKNNNVENLSVGKAQRDAGRRGASRKLGGNESLISNRISKGWCENCASTILPGDPGCTHK